MISMMEVDDWLRAHTRIVNDGLVWPRGMRYSWETSRKIAHTYLALGLNPSEDVTIDLVQSLLHRLEVLEQAITTLTAPDMATLSVAANAEFLREGVSKVRISSAENMNDLQTYLEGGTEESQGAARRLDGRNVDTGRMSPAAFAVLWGELPEVTEMGHRYWCRQATLHGRGECTEWGKI